eukprot:CAMPEP_0197664628 /NCGR_PEP_ID=MMETSP1338-20131121/58755_1 /TAXON_ID=43686 ORGANISM="Pelagodinium beii, Strain RCC1491" /NCGR_SAMPLE_ID=MMETSP1338 /ASSEMBLY_ACC=CAM_ASM_000754 /LENGTH=345 /DNA_ID=CAMNT_0043243311 /DNA_START=59 /DNA_END=1096 /DNA_ORIENTATION=-
MTKAILILGMGATTMLANPFIAFAEPSSIAALGADDECLADNCALNALQHRGAATADESASCETANPNSHCGHAIHWAKTQGIRQHPQWYPGLTTHSSDAEFQSVIHHAKPRDCPMPCTVQEASSCHDAKPGESCFNDIHWAKTQGIHQHPGWYPGLSPSSSDSEFQAQVHAKRPEKCPKPCEKEVAKPAPVAPVAPVAPKTTAAPVAPKTTAAPVAPKTTAAPVAPATTKPPAPAAEESEDDDFHIPIEDDEIEEPEEHHNSHSSSGEPGAPAVGETPEQQRAREQHEQEAARQEQKAREAQERANKAEERKEPLDEKQDRLMREIGGEPTDGLPDFSGDDPDR